jgi:hypothetical protein
MLEGNLATPFRIVMTDLFRIWFISTPVCSSLLIFAINRIAQSFQLSFPPPRNMSSEFEGLDYCDKDVYESEGFDYESCLPCSPYPSPPLLLSPQMLRKHRARKFFQPPLPPLPPLPPRLCLNCSSAQVTQVYLQPAKMCTEHSRVRGHEYSRRDRERRKRLIEQDQRKQRAQQGAFKVCASRTFTSRKEHSRINH